jgi:hypothetical protein
VQFKAWCIDADKRVNARQNPSKIYSESTKVKNDYDAKTLGNAVLVSAGRPHRGRL